MMSLMRIGTRNLTELPILTRRLDTRTVSPVATTRMAAVISVFGSMPISFGTVMYMESPAFLAVPMK